MSSKESFVWQDEDLINFHKFYMGKNSDETIWDSLIQFKKSKMPKPEFEVLRYTVTWDNGVRGEEKVWQVKRLLDGEIFTVGDTVRWDDILNVKIDGFEIPTYSDQEMMIKGDGIKHNLRFAKKLPPQPKPEQPKRVPLNTIHCQCPNCDEQFDITPPSGTTIPNPIREQPKRIEVEEIEFITDGAVGRGVYYFETSKQFSNERLFDIKKAIEFAINDGIEIKSNLFKFYDYHTDSELRQAEEKAFNAAREMTGYNHTGGWGGDPQKIPMLTQKYPTFQDYLTNSKSPKP